MTINGSTNMTMRDSLGHKVDKRCKRVWCTDNGQSWPSAVACAKAHGVHVQNIIYVCNGKQNTCKGLHFSYEENVAEVQERMAQTISERNDKMAELERKAALWDAHQKEQEAIRKAEENRINAINKAKAKLERRQRIYDRKMDECKTCYARLMEAKQELAKLNENA